MLQKRRSSTTGNFEVKQRRFFTLSGCLARKSEKLNLKSNGSHHSTFSFKRCFYKISENVILTWVISSAIEIQFFNNLSSSLAEESKVRPDLQGSQDMTCKPRT
ncbi:hypothetical protein V1264_015634 [Littorina saxatilis]|uniref:Uncharacterized protein n=1 Tax=Littorina saxatilis TaxID=31220 RepID=A0AAN9GGP4_9CAEN